MLQNHKKGNQQEPGVRFCGIQDGGHSGRGAEGQVPYTQGRVVSTRRAVLREWKSNQEAKMRSKKLYIASIHGPQVGRNKDILDVDIEEYFRRYGEVVGVSQESERDGGKKKGSG